MRTIPFFTLPNAEKGTGQPHITLDQGQGPASRSFCKRALVISKLQVACCDLLVCSPPPPEEGVHC